MRSIIFALVGTTLFASAVLAQSTPTGPSAPSGPSTPNTPTAPGGANGGAGSTTAFDRLSTEYLNQARRAKDTTPNAANYDAFRK